MRKLALFAAVLGMITAPMVPASAEETADIYSKDGVQGPSFARSTQCAAIFATALNATEEGSEDYEVSVKIGTAWLKWARQIAEGRDADGTMNDKVAAFNQSVAGLSPEGASAELAKEIKGCQAVKNLMSTMEPFATIYNETLTGKPGFNTAVDCATAYSVIAQSIGEKDGNYDWFNDGVEMWTQYALDQMKGSDKQKVDAISVQATARSAVYTKLFTDDEDAGLAQLVADRDKCKGLEPSFPKYFKNR